MTIQLTVKSFSPSALDCVRRHPTEACGQEARKLSIKTEEVCNLTLGGDFVSGSVGKLVCF
jgi:hypothetical protein